MSVTVHKPIADLSPAEITAQMILKLLNEKPQTPTVQEIAALIGKPAAGGGLVLTISGIAQEIADLWRLTAVLEKGERQQDKLLEDEPAAEPFVPFEELKALTDSRKDTLEQVLLDLEPDTLDEALSLLVMTASLFEGWASDAYANQDLNKRAEREWQTLTHGFEAIARWLVHRGGAKSALIPVYFRTPWLAPPREQIANALARARELAEQAGRTEEDDGHD